MAKHVESMAKLEEEFKAAGSKPIIIDFYAQWCGPCKMIAPKLEDFAKKYTNVILIKVDVDVAEDVASKYDVTAMPTFKVFKEGKVIDTLVGANQEKVEALFKKHNS